MMGADFWRIVAIPISIMPDDQIVRIGARPVELTHAARELARFMVELYLFCTSYSGFERFCSVRPRSSRRAAKRAAVIRQRGSAPWSSTTTIRGRDATAPASSPPASAPHSPPAMTAGAARATSVLISWWPPTVSTRFAAASFTPCSASCTPRTRCCRRRS